MEGWLKESKTRAMMTAAQCIQDSPCTVPSLTNDGNDAYVCMLGRQKELSQIAMMHPKQ
jgi:hypothetical protein